MRRAEVRVLRVVPEVFVSPHAGTPAVRAAGDDRKRALFEDEMTHGMLPVGGYGGFAGARRHAVRGRPLRRARVDLRISGVATKTS